MKWIVSYLGWVALWISFFCPPVQREQIIAVETLLCTFLPPSALHVVVVTFVLVYFTQTGHRSELWAAVAHHLIIALSVLVQYVDSDYRLRCWLALGWSSRWLGSFLIYDIHPLRECLKCVLFYIVVQCHKSWTFSNTYDYKNSFKWLWVLFVHEIVWVCLPVQMLFEVYVSQKSTLPT
jgi:hypothetical protein